jgi:hypothetical protein
VLVVEELEPVAELDVVAAPELTADVEPAEVEVDARPAPPVVVLVVTLVEPVGLLPDEPVVAVRA